MGAQTSAINTANLSLLFCQCDPQSLAGRVYDCCMQVSTGSAHLFHFFLKQPCFLLLTFPLNFDDLQGCPCNLETVCRGADNPGYWGKNCEWIKAAHPGWWYFEHGGMLSAILCFSVLPDAFLLFHKCLSSRKCIKAVRPGWFTNSILYSLKTHSVDPKTRRS